MIKEKHYVNRVYGNHQLARYIDIYEVSANRCHSVPESGYKGTEATLVNEPAWNEKFSSYSITGATLTGNNFILNNDVTAKANYETAKNLTLQTDGHGSIAANKNSGFIGDQVTLSNTPATNYVFNNYTITGATLTSNKFNFIGSDVTAKANFRLTGTTYYTNNNTYSVQKPGTQAVPTAYTLTTNIDITPMNYAVIKYDVDSYTGGAIISEGPRVTLYTNEALLPIGYHSYTGDRTHYFSGNLIQSLGTYNGTGAFKFIIDRSAHRGSAFYNNNLIDSKTFTFNYAINIVDTATKTADDITKINELYWKSDNSWQKFSNIRIAGTTSYADAYNY